ncbi:TRAP transporter large permease subunit [Marinobacterium sp. CAU 1594]|nr:TRAP transporter large permease subunit [Marinobacterium arenosum]
MGATNTSLIIAFIVAGSALLATAMKPTRIPVKLTNCFESPQLLSYLLGAVLPFLIIIRGCLIDGISVVILTASIIMPMIEKAGINLTWLAFYFVIVAEISKIVPVVGFNLIALQALT